MGVKAAEDFITHCHRCNKEFTKPDVRIPSYREGRFWYECLECFEKEGGVTWVGKPPKITILRPH